MVNRPTIFVVYSCSFLEKRLEGRGEGLRGGIDMERRLGGRGRCQSVCVVGRSGHGEVMEGGGGMEGWRGESV